jgi:TPR repeat protein
VEAAQMGHAGALLRSGHFARDGVAGRRSWPLARRHFHSAARQLRPEAVEALAAMFVAQQHGNHFDPPPSPRSRAERVRTNEATGRALYRLAASLGSESARWHLAGMERSGMGAGEGRQA